MTGHNFGAQSGHTVRMKPGPSVDSAELEQDLSKIVVRVESDHARISVTVR